MPRTPLWRPTARLIVLDPDNRILLFRFPGAWLTPGGGLHQGETPEAAAVRELAEETGYIIAEADIGPVVATCAGQWRTDDGTVYFGADSFFCVRAEGTEILTEDREDYEQALITEYRWWTLDELLETTDRVFPEGLPDLIAQLLETGLPEWPVQLPWRSLDRALTASTSNRAAVWPVRFEAVMAALGCLRYHPGSPRRSRLDANMPARPHLAVSCGPRFSEPAGSRGLGASLPERPSPARARAQPADGRRGSWQPRY